MSEAPGEIALFLRRWLANPLRVGAILPSSPALARLVARNAVRTPDDIVVELGAGTGTVTKALCDAGLPAAGMVLIELDADYVAFLQRRFPEAQVIAGDASTPAELVPATLRGRVDTVISGIPALQFPLDKQRHFIDQCFEVLRPGGQVLQYTYTLNSPLPREPLGIEGERVGTTFANVPPAHVWCYTRPGMAEAARPAAE